MPTIVSSPKRGEIWLLNLADKKGKPIEEIEEVYTTSPCLILSNDLFNYGSEKIVFAKLSSKSLSNPDVEIFVPRSNKNGLDVNSKVCLNDLHSVRKKRAKFKIGDLADQMKEVDKKLRSVLGLE